MGAPAVIDDDVPPPPPGFSIVRKPPPRPVKRLKLGANGRLVPTGDAYDGDTFETDAGPSARLFGVDAFELAQTGRAPDGSPVPLGVNARNALLPYLAPGATVAPTGNNSFGRPIVDLSRGGDDAGLSLVQSGNALPDPRFVGSAGPVANSYVDAQRAAIASERGAYAGTYQAPWDYRRSGSAAPWRGKIAMPREDSEQWVAMMRNPQVTEEQIAGWLAARGHSAENIANIRSMLRQNRAVGLRMFYQQEDVADKPVAPAVPFIDRQAAALAEGVPDVTGLPAQIFHDNPASFGPVGQMASSVLGIANAAIGQERHSSAPLPEFSVKARDAVGRPAPDEVGMFADDPNQPKTGWRYSKAAEAEIERAIRSGDFEATMAVLQKNAPPGVTIAPDTAGSVARSIAFFQKHPGVPFTQKGAVDYSAVDSEAGTAQAKAEAEQMPVGGVEWQRNLMHSSGIGQLDERYAPQSDGERYLQAGLRALPSALLPIAGEGLAAANLSRKVIATGVLGAIGSGIGAQAADDFSPGSPLAMLAGQVIGGGIGGLGGRRFAGRNALPDGSPIEVSLTGGAREPVAPSAGDVPTPPAGFRIVDDKPGAAAPTAPSIASMRSEAEAPELVAPDFGGARVPDRIDINQPPALPRPRDVLDINANRPRPLLDDVTDQQRAAELGRLAPGDVLPIPPSRIADLGEAEAIEAGRYAPVRAPNERDVLGSRAYRSPRDAQTILRRRGPADLVTWLRTKGGLQEWNGELRHAGIDNKPRTDLEFTGGENQLGKLVDDENGLTLDEAALQAWEAGYFPDHTERPTINEFLDALIATHRGGSGRVFHPDDYAELDQYRAAQQQRWEVERAKDAGAPLATDRSEPASLADMDANAAPVEAYHEWGESAPDFAGNIRLEKLDSPQAIKRALVQVGRATGDFDAARRGRITLAETERLAAELNLSPADLLRRRKGQAFNAEQALAARQILAKSANELVNGARRIARGDATDADLAMWQKMLTKHAAIQEQVSGITAEAGRALSSLRGVADARAVNGQVLKSLIESGAGAKRIKDAAEMVIENSGGAERIKAAAQTIVDNADDPARLNATVQAVLKPTLKDKLVEVYYNFLLSGPRTHAINVTSNFLTSLAQIPEHAVAAGVGAVRKALPGQAETDRVLFTEPGQRTLGMLQGAQEGFRQFARAMRTGEPSDGFGKLEAQRQRAVRGPVGTVLRTPSRLLIAEDEFFKAMARRMEIVGLAARQARKEGGRREAIRQRTAELIDNPTPEMIEQAANYARYVTFQRPLGPGGQAVSNLTEKVPVLKLFIPFVRTPTNLLKFAVERSPVSPLLKEWRADVVAGGARRDLAIARSMVGTGAIGLAIEAARRGMVTGGGPADESAKRLLEADGWQPYSVKVKGKYYSYARLDPFSTTIGMAADYVDLQSYMTDKERDRIATTIAAAMLKNLSSKTWLSGMANLGEAVDDPGRYGEGFAARLAGTTVPALVAQTAQSVDPVQREAQSMLDRIRSRIPYASRSLPVRRDVLGRPRDNGNSGGLESFSPVYVGQERGDRVANALLGAGVSIAPPSRTVGGQELSPMAYDAYQARAGELLRNRLAPVVGSQSWLDLSPDERKRALEAAIRGSRREARGLPAAPSRSRPADIPPPPPGFSVVQ